MEAAPVASLEDDTASEGRGDDPGSSVQPKPRWFSRDAFSGAILFNSFTFLLPALYATLSKLWIARIDSSSVATTDAYTYLGVITEVLNEGLPRAAYLVIGDLQLLFSDRLQLLSTLLIFQMGGGLLLSLFFLALAPLLADTFVPHVGPTFLAANETLLEDLMGASNPVAVTYIRISAFSTFFTVTEYALGCSLRALDRPDVPLVISLTKVTLNIVLDMIFLSKWGIYPSPTVTTQATVRLVCDGLGAGTGLLYLLLTTFRRRDGSASRRRHFRWDYLRKLGRPGFFTFSESLVRNILYLWLIVGIVALGQEYATAWGVFNTIRWGIVMVPTNALAESTAAFTAHRWNLFRRGLGDESTGGMTWRGLLPVLHYAFISSAVVFAVESVLAIAFSFWLAEPMAFYLSGDEAVAALTATMWRTMDWTYVLFAVSLQLSTVLLASWPFWYLVNTLLGNLLWVLPWAIVMQSIEVTEENAWSYHSVIFGGSLVIGFVMAVSSLGAWGYAIVNRERWRRWFNYGLTF